MLSVSRIAIALVGATIIAACSTTEDDIKNALQKSAIALKDLEQHVVTYENVSDKSTTTDIYCPNGDLRDDAQKSKGSWMVNGAVLTTMVNGATTDIDTTATGNELRDGSSYDIGGGVTFKVTSIKQTVCQ